LGQGNSTLGESPLRRKKGGDGDQKKRGTPDPGEKKETRFRRGPKISAPLFKGGKQKGRKKKKKKIVRQKKIAQKGKEKKVLRGKTSPLEKKGKTGRKEKKKTL